METAGALKLMSLCSTVIHPPNDHSKRLRLAVEAAKVKNEAGLDFSDPSKLCVGGKNPLHEACRVGNYPIVRLFIANGANVNVLDENGMTPLNATITSYHGCDKTACCLLTAGADVNLFKEGGRSPLLAAFYSKKMDISIKLIQKGADVNNAALPSFLFVEVVFALHTSIVMVTSGVRLQLDDFSLLMTLALEIIKAGLHQRTFFMTGRFAFEEGFSSKQLSALWHFQSLCLAAGFKIDRFSLHDAMSTLLETLNDTVDPSHRQSLYQQMDHFQIMDRISSNPLSLTRLSRMSIRAHLASLQTSPAMHLSDKVDLLPVPNKLKDFISLRTL